MELDYSTMFSNKLVASGEYMAKVVFVRTVKQIDGKEVLEVEVVIDNNESQYDGTHLTAILHPTPKGQRFIDAFKESYLVNQSTLQQAVGRWASVYVYESLYKGSVFSAVKFHKQTAAALSKVAELEALPSRAPVIVPSLPLSGRIEWSEIRND